jgi:hypothetical protein
MIADAEQRQIWSGPPLRRWELGVGIALLLLVLPAAILPTRDSAAGKWRRAFATAAIVLAALMLASRLGIAQHHLIAVLPLALSAVTLLALETARRFRSAMPPLAVLGVGLLALFVRWDLRIDRGLRRTGGTWSYSSAIDDARRHLASNHVPPERLKILNWGFQNNFYVASGGALYGTELYWGATRDMGRPGRTWAQEIADGGSFLAFVTPAGVSPLNAASEGFAEALARYEGPRRETVFPDRLGKPHVRLVEIARGR